MGPVTTGLLLHACFCTPHTHSKLDAVSASCALTCQLTSTHAHTHTASLSCWPPLQAATLGQVAQIKVPMRLVKDAFRINPTGNVSTVLVAAVDVVCWEDGKQRPGSIIADIRGKASGDAYLTTKDYGEWCADPSCCIAVPVVCGWQWSTAAYRRGCMSGGYTLLTDAPSRTPAVPMQGWISAAARRPHPQAHKPINPGRVSLTGAAAAPGRPVQQLPAEAGR